VHDLGSWCFALSEPGIYAVALARAHDDVSLEASEQSLFGQNHGEIGASLLERAGFRPDFIQAATPGDTSGWPSARDPLSVACVHLGSTLAWSAIARDEGHASKLKTRLLSSEDPVWQLVSAGRAALPMDLPEFVDTLFAAAETCLAMVNSISGDSPVPVK
jgi:hypothetical protein